MTRYGTLQNDKSQRKLLAAVAAGTNEIPADALAPGSVPRSVVSLFAERERSVADWGANPDGTDCSASFRTADAWCAANGYSLYIPPGTWTFTTPFSGTVSPFTPVLSSWRGAGRNLTILRANHSTSFRTFQLAPEVSTSRRAQSRSQVSPYNTVYAINDVLAGQRFIQFTTLGDLTALIAAGGIAVGELWHVAGGKNVQDADDPLWYYDQLHEIRSIDAVNGKIYFKDSIDYTLTSQGWDGSGAGKNLAATYANATAYTAGQYVWDDVATSTLYVATTSGTSNSANRSTDTGVIWAQVTTALGALKTGAVDHRPVFQKAAGQIKDLAFSDFTIDWTGSQAASPVLIHGAYNILYERCGFRNSFVYIAEASRNIVFRDCDFDRDAADAANSARDAVYLYQSRKVRLVNCRINGGNVSTVAVGNRTFKIESHGEILLENCEISHTDPAAPQGYLALIDRGEFYMKGGSARGYLDPVRFNITKLYEETAPIIPFAADLQSVNPISMAGYAFRLGGLATGEDAPPLYFRPSNTYLMRTVYSSGAHVQTPGTLFVPSQYLRLSFSFTPATGQSGTVVDLPNSALAALGVTTPDALAMVFLGMSVIWETPGANDLDIRPRAKHVTSAAARNLFSLTAGSNRIIVNSTTPTGRKFTGDGTTYRWLQSGVDRFQLTYISGASAGGTLYVTIHVLV